MKRETGTLLKKAHRAILAGKMLLAKGDADFAAGRAYYAMFYTAGALLFEQDVRVAGRTAVHRAFGDYFVKTGALSPTLHRWLLDAHDRRIVGDYGIEMHLSVDNVRTTLQQAQAFLLEARRCIDLGRLRVQENKHIRRKTS